MLNPWIVIPITVVCLLMLAGHVIYLGHAEEYRSRRRIRQANGTLSMLTIATMCAGLCLFSPETMPREWALSWLAVMMLVTMHVLLAMGDALNTARLRRHAIRQFREASKRFREELLQIGSRIEREAADTRND